MSIMNFSRLRNALKAKLGFSSSAAFPVKAEVVSSTSMKKGHSIFTLTQITQYPRTMAHKYQFTLEVETDDPQDKIGYELNGKPPHLSNLGFWFRQLKSEMIAAARYRNVRVNKVSWEEIKEISLPRESN
tara:strand:+ start:293 stop:682 length:390 start_codon:yes stop_codon:yes gene_type:complete